MTLRREQIIGLLKEGIILIFLFQGKLDMLENLLEIEVAYSLLKSANDGGDDGKSKDPIDAHYEKLKTDIKVGKLSLFFSCPPPLSLNTFSIIGGIL